MSDWNTLHLFNSNKFYKEIVIKLLENRKYIENFISCKSYKSYYPEQLLKCDIDNIIKYFNQLTVDFKSNKRLLEIESSQKKLNQEYKEFIKIKNSKVEEFYSENEKVIEKINKFLPYLIYSECVYKKPYLSIGRTIFNSNIKFEAKSMAEELIRNINNQELGNTHCYFGAGIINWLTAEEVELLYLDRMNLKDIKKENEEYKNKFLKILEIANKNNLGLITFSNLQDNLITKLNIKHSIQ